MKVLQFNEYTIQKGDGVGGGGRCLDKIAGFPSVAQTTIQPWVGTFK